MSSAGPDSCKRGRFREGVGGVVGRGNITDNEEDEEEDENGGDGDADKNEEGAEDDEEDKEGAESAAADDADEEADDGADDGEAVKIERATSDIRVNRVPAEGWVGGLFLCFETVQGAPFPDAVSSMQQLLQRLFLHTMFVGF